MTTIILENYFKAHIKKDLPKSFLKEIFGKTKTFAIKLFFARGFFRGKRSGLNNTQIKFMC